MSVDLRNAVSAYIRDRLEGESLLREPPDRNLQAVFVVPVHREPIRRVLELMSSLAKLEGNFEVLCVVNNGPDDGTSKFHEARNANALVMQLPLWRNADGFGSSIIFPESVLKQAREIRSSIPVFLIDKSSRGHELPKGNVGAARDRGLAEAAARFLRLERNGLVIFLDADVIVEDAAYLKKALEIFERELDLTVAAGGIDYRFDPDVSQPRERAREIDQLKQYLEMRKWELLNEFVQSGRVNLLPTNACIGSHVLARAFQAAAMGGWPHSGFGEDTEFGLTGNCKKADALRVNAALRYQHWMGREFDPSVDHAELPFTKEEMAELTRKISASEQGRAVLARLEDISSLLYRSISVR